MEIINIIKIENGIVKDVDSFKVYDRDLSDEEIEVAESKYKESVEVAEKEFLRKAKELGWTEKEMTKADLLDEGFYDTEFEIYASVNICWTQV